MGFIDSYGREISYLRLSVTERCNLRCRYCMPPEGVHKLSHHDILSFEELLLAARAAVSMAGPSRNYRIDGAVGSVGIITPITGHFCDACNRIRLTASGSVRSCLFSEQEYDLKPFLRFNDEAAVKVALRRIIRNKPERHLLSVNESEHQLFAMSSVGG